MPASNRARLILASSLTKLHPGAGRSPGLVDLPVIRDPLGYYFVPGTMLKGTLRTIFPKRLEKEGGNSKNNDVKCLFGPETTDAKKFAGSLTFHDLYPLFVPAPSPELGVAYATTPYLLSRAAELAGLASQDDLKGALESLAKLPAGDGGADAVIVGSPGNIGTVRVGAHTLRASVSQTQTGSIQDIIKDLHVLYRSVPLQGRLVVLSPRVAAPVLESLLMRLTRVRLNPDTKTVERGGLWTEEYIPWGTLFVGAVVDNGFRGSVDNGFKRSYCSSIDPLGKIEEVVGNSFTLVLGGKETVGGGVVRIRLLGGGGSGSS